MEELLRNIDYRMLAGQKLSLDNVLKNPLLSQTEKDSLNGILNLIDSIQDKVVEKGILTEEEVFPYLKLEENE